MDGFELTQSFVLEDQKNEFLNQDFNYENCPHCQRNFFLGKLKYHLKLCKPSNPMIKSSIRNNKKSHFSVNIDKPTPPQPQQNAQQPQPGRTPQNKYKKCEYCRATFPLSMIKRHSQKCSLKPNTQRIAFEVNNLKSKTNIDFQFKKEIKETSSALPRIRNSAKQHKNFERKFVTQDFKEGKTSYTVKIRQDLSCFKKALQVQQIQCPYCSRKFSKEASLRHIPICQKLKNQQIQQIVQKKHAKSQSYKINVPAKKSILLRQKVTVSVSRGQNQSQIRSARLLKAQKTNRQKTNNTTFLKNQDQKEEKQFKYRSLKKQNKSNQREKVICKKFSEQKNPIQIPHSDMNMTFNKNFNDPLIQVGKRYQFKIQNFEKQQDSQNPFLQLKEEINSQSLEQSSIEMENEFLQVSASKKRFFEQIKMNPDSKICQGKTNLQQSSVFPSLKNLKIKISLKDIHGQQGQKAIEQKV